MTSLTLRKTIGEAHRIGVQVGVELEPLEVCAVVEVVVSVAELGAE